MVHRLVHSFRTSDATNASLLFIASPEDREQLDALENHGPAWITVPWQRGRGDWAKKINFGYRKTDEPWVLCAADDIHFHPGWDGALRRAMKTGKRVLGTNDLNPNANPTGIYSPHPLVARSYADGQGVVDKPKQVVCEQYDHNYPDRELAATAISRDEWLFVPDAIIEHLHPSVTGTPADDTYRLGAQRAQRDYLMYIRRHRLWIREKRLRERAARAYPR
jgi:hypothetical protein